MDLDVRGRWAPANGRTTGDELATARALSDLAHHLLDVASADVEDAVARFPSAGTAAR